MLKIKLAKGYSQSYWDSGNGVTISKGQVVECDEDNWIVRHALDSGILEVVTEDKDSLNIITDKPIAKTIKEVVGPDVMKENKEALAESNRKTMEENAKKTLTSDKFLKEAEKNEDADRPEI